MGGAVMLIGVDQESNTTVHCCEELAGVDYHLQDETVEIPLVGLHGERILVRNRLHNWQKPPTDFNKFDELYVARGIMKIGRVGDSVVRLINAKDMVEYSVERLTREPHFLIR
jgi:aminoglycoside 3-N-acetyltransferase